MNELAWCSGATGATHAPTHTHTYIYMRMLICTSVLANIEALLYKMTLLRGIPWKKRPHELNANHGGRQSNNENRNCRQKKGKRRVAGVETCAHMHTFICVLRRCVVVYCNFPLALQNALHTFRRCGLHCCYAPVLTTTSACTVCGCVVGVCWCGLLLLWLPFVLLLPHFYTQNIRKVI